MNYINLNLWLKHHPWLFSNHQTWVPWFSMVFPPAKTPCHSPRFETSAPIWGTTSFWYFDIPNTRPRPGWHSLLSPPGGPFQNGRIRIQMFTPKRLEVYKIARLLGYPETAIKGLYPVRFQTFDVLAYHDWWWMIVIDSSAESASEGDSQWGGIRAYCCEIRTAYFKANQKESWICLICLITFNCTSPSHHLLLFIKQPKFPLPDMFLGLFYNAPSRPHQLQQHPLQSPHVPRRMK